MTDNYEWMKTNESQSSSDYSPYTDKQYSNYINDINGGSYSNSSLSLVNFDLGQIYNSNKYIDSSDLYSFAYKNGSCLQRCRCNYSTWY